MTLLDKTLNESRENGLLITNVPNNEVPNGYPTTIEALKKCLIDCVKDGDYIFTENSVTKYVGSDGKTLHDEEIHVDENGVAEDIDSVPPNKAFKPAKVLLRDKNSKNNIDFNKSDRGLYICRRPFEDDIKKGNILQKYNDDEYQNLDKDPYAIVLKTLDKNELTGDKNDVALIKKFIKGWIESEHFSKYTVEAMMSPNFGYHQTEHDKKSFNYDPFNEVHYMYRVIIPNDHLSDRKLFGGKDTNSVYMKFGFVEENGNVNLNKIAVMSIHKSDDYRYHYFRGLGKADMHKNGITEEVIASTRKSLFEYFNQAAQYLTSIWSNYQVPSLIVGDKKVYGDDFKTSYSLGTQDTYLKKIVCEENTMVCEPDNYSIRVHAYFSSPISSNASFRENDMTETALIDEYFGYSYTPYYRVGHQKRDKFQAKLISPQNAPTFSKITNPEGILKFPGAEFGLDNPDEVSFITLKQNGLRLYLGFSFVLKLVPLQNEGDSYDTHKNNSATKNTNSYRYKQANKNLKSDVEDLIYTSKAGGLAHLDPEDYKKLSPEMKRNLHNWSIEAADRSDEVTGRLSNFKIQGKEVTGCLPTNKELLLDPITEENESLFIILSDIIEASNEYSTEARAKANKKLGKELNKKERQDIINIKNAIDDCGFDEYIEGCEEAVNKAEGTKANNTTPVYGSSDELANIALGESFKFSNIFFEAILNNE